VSRVFLSHSSKDARQTVALKQWLVEQDASLAAEIFVDLDPEVGIPAGVQWREALKKASDRCEAVICLLSRNWVESTECRQEYDTALELHKRMFCARLEESAADALTSQWQRCDLFGAGSTTTVDIGDGEPPVSFATSGLQRLFNGIRGAGIGAELFGWPPKDDPNRKPYRGWEPLTEADAAVFFGRDAEIVRGLDTLRGMRLGGVKRIFAVLGPSGAGKSSFLRAGLLPHLRRYDRDIVVLNIVRPERAALTGDTGLAQSIYATRARFDLDEPSPEDIKAMCLAGDSASISRLLNDIQRAAQRRLLEDDGGAAPPAVLLPVDQAEELFTVDAGAQADQLMQLIKGIVDEGLNLFVACTIRTDRYEAMQTAPALDGLQTVTFNDLKPMSQMRFAEVIKGPAARATAAGDRLQVDDELVRQLLADCTEGADTLPILSLTLARLYVDHGQSGRLTLEHYQAMGGMHHIVQSEIDSVLARDPNLRQAQLQLLRSAFVPWLVTINPENDQPMRRVARWCDLPTESNSLIDALVRKRLMVKDTRDGELVVEVALESLLRQWDELAGWLREQRHDLKSADDFEKDANAWRTSDRDDAWLLTGTRLTEAEGLLTKPGFGQRIAAGKDFVVASREAEDERLRTDEQRREAELRNAQERQATAESHSATLRKRSRILRAVLAVTVVAAVVAAVGFVQASAARNQAQARFQEATSVRLVAEAQGMLTDTRPGSDDRALQQLLVADALAPKTFDGPLYTAAVKTFDTQKVFQTGLGIIRAAVSPDGRFIVTAGDGGVLRRWDAETGHEIGPPFKGHDGWVSALKFSPDGHRLVSGGDDRTVRLWNVETGEQIGKPLVGHTDEVWDAVFSPDGHLVASGGVDGTVRLWNADTGEPIGEPLAGHTDVVTRVAFSPDGRRLVSGSHDGTVRMWDVGTHQQIGDPFARHDAGRKVKAVAFSPDGRLLASAGTDRAVRLWDSTTGAPVGPALMHAGSALEVVFSPDGSRIATTVSDNSAVCGTSKPANRWAPR
jgi:hypothetical protein